MKKAAIYDRWLHVLGGGERHTVALAQAVSENGYEVEILTHRPTNLKALKNKFGIKQLNFTVKYIPEAWDYQLSPYTKEYDLFILSSFSDIFASKAKKSILSVFFPISQKLTFKEYLTRVIFVPFFRSLFQFNLYTQYDDGLITIGRNKEEQEITIEIFLPQLALSTVEQLMVTSIDNKVNFSTKVIHQRNVVQINAIAKEPAKQWQLHFPVSQYSEGVAVKVRDSLWNNLAESVMRLIPFIGERMKAGPRRFSLNEIKSYDKVVANSQFTAKWIKKYWEIDSQVVYPPVNLEEFTPSKQKKNWIVSTGRFFVGGHNKKQLELVQSFKHIYKYIPDWELHLVGSVNDGEVHQKYFEQVKEEANGYPIFIHENVSFSELKEILEQSKIYWHASGLGIDGEKYPVMIEHFGLTIVEAMATGCVPVVINKGGPAEVAKEVGITWNNLTEMEEKTIELINDEKKISSIKKQLIEYSKKYNSNQFKSKIHSIISNI